MALSPIPSIPTPRLTLREIVPADLADLMQVNGDPAVTKFLPYATWESEQDAAAWFERMNKLAEGGTARQLVVIRNGDLKVIGTVLLFKFDEGSARIELGYVIGQDHWRQGYAAEAVGAALSHAFSELGVRRVEAEVDADNVASNALLRKLGFTCEGFLRDKYVSKGRTHGVNIYGLLAAEWRGSRAA